MVSIQGMDVWMKGMCFVCEICTETLMDSEQMDEFRKEYGRLDKEQKDYNER